MPKNLEESAALWLALAIVPALALYLASMSDAITLIDAGLFHMVCMDNGIAHPPGYPLATALCHPFMNLPLPGTLPGNLFSTTFSVAALAALFFLLRLLSFEPGGAGLATLLFAVSWTFWSQSIVIEIYSLNMLLVCLLFITCLQFEKSGEARWLVAAALVFGLGVANHWPLIVLAAIATAPVLLQDTRALKTLARPQWLVGIVAALAAGVSPYLLMLGKPDAYMTMIGPVESLKDVWLYASRSTYEDNAIVTGTQSIDYVAWLVQSSINQWGPVGWVLVPIGMIRAAIDLRWPHAASIGLLWMTHCILLPLLSTYPFDEGLRYYYLTWAIPAHLSTAVWLYLGARYLLAVLPLAEKTCTALVLLLCAATGLYNFTRTNPADAYWVEEYNRLLLASLPPDPVLFVEGDNQTGPIGYLHHVEGMREDLELRSRHNILFGNRLADPRGFTAEQEKVIQDFVAASTRPVFFISPPRVAPVRDHGFYFEVGKTGFATHAALDAFMARLIPVLHDDLVADPVIRLYLNEMVYQYARVIVGLAITSEGVDQSLSAPLMLVSSTLQGKTWTLHHLLGTGRDDIDRTRLFSLIAAGEQQVTDRSIRRGAGTFLRLAGDAFARYGEDDRAALLRYRRARQFDLQNETCDYLRMKETAGSGLNYHEELNCEN